MTIYYHVPYRPDHITGGIKTAYSHVAQLRAAGMAAAVWSPLGAANWLPDADMLATVSVHPGPDDVLVLDEMLHPQYAPLMALPCRREMFVQNQYYLMQKGFLDQSPAQLGYHAVFTCSTVARQAIEAVYGWPDVDVVPCAVDSNTFHPLGKGLAVALVPSKLPRHAAWIQHVFLRRHPDLAAVPWWPLQGKTQQQVAQALGKAGVFLSLSDMESLGLATLEAMASGCAVVGYPGSAAQEYVTAQNGRWFSPYEIIGVADALAECLRQIAKQDARIIMMMQAGIDMAARFSPAATQAALIHHFAKGLAA